MKVKKQKKNMAEKSGWKIWLTVVHIFNPNSFEAFVVPLIDTSFKLRHTVLEMMMMMIKPPISQQARVTRGTYQPMKMHIDWNSWVMWFTHSSADGDKCLLFKLYLYSVWDSFFEDFSNMVYIFTFYGLKK